MIWKIRDSIQELEVVKDEIIVYLDAQETLEDSTKQMWISDVKEVYYNIVAAWEMLNAASRNDKTHAVSCQKFLENAHGRLGQVASELSGLDGERASQLELALKRQFVQCSGEISAELEKYTTKRESQKPTTRVIEIDDSTYELPCSVCSVTAVSFKVGIPRFGKEERLIYKGIVTATSLELKDSPKVFNWLRREEISRIHAFLKQSRVLEDGIDAYCPRCKKIYCKAHYKVRIVWDDGYYDCAYGTCPNGHERIIDD